MSLNSSAHLGENQLISPESIMFVEAANFVIERARKLTEELIEARGGHAEPPFWAKEYASLRGVKKVVEMDLGELSGLVIRLQGGYVIKVNSSHHLLRQNFSCAHEIGHTLLHELEKQTTPSGMDFRTTGLGVQGPAIERLCDMAAAELLMPETVFKRYISEADLSVSSVERLAHTFRVSIPSAAIRIAELCSCVALLWKPYRTRRSSGFHLVWAAGPGRRKMGKPTSAPVNKWVRNPSILLKAYDSTIPCRSFNVFEISKTKERCRMESKGFGQGKDRYVVSLAFPKT